MIRIKFDPYALEEPLKSDWEHWQERAREAIEETIDTWEAWAQARSHIGGPPAWKQEIWAEFKKWLLDNFFHNKCAYCETLILRFDAHAEHFRPKGRVTVRKGGRLEPQKTLDEGGQEVEHPGYFWLAYHWKNLLPSCGFCNGGEGKLNQFPIKGRHIFLHKADSSRLHNFLRRPYPSSCRPSCYYLEPDDLDVLEKPLLLHPYIDDPAQHLRFGDRGIVTALTEKGEASIDVYNLESDPLRRERQRLQRSALNTFLLALMNSDGDQLEKKRAAWGAVESYRKGVEPYSAAVCDYIDEVIGSLGRP